MLTLDSSGIATQTLQEIIDETAAAMRIQMEEPTLDTSSAESAIGNIITVLADREYQADLKTRDIYSATTPSGATGQAATNLARLTGTTRPLSTYSTVTLKLSLEAGATVPQGSVFKVPDEIYAWYTQAAVTNSGGTTADFEVLAKASAPGAVRANDHTITEPVSSLVGLVSVTNELDAQMGRDAFTDTELMILREQELQATGVSTAGAIDAALSELTGVIDVLVLTPNDSEAPGTFRAVVWDGTSAAADDDQIAQAILDEKDAGSVSNGSQSGNATSYAGVPYVIHFDRATEVQVYMTVEIKIDATKFPVDGDTQIINKVTAKASSLWKLGVDVVSQQLVPTVFEVSGVVDVPLILVRNAPFPISPATIVIPQTSVATADTGRTTVVHV